METLDSIWESSRHNEWSFAFPLILSIGTIVLVMFSLIRIAILRRCLKVVGILILSYFVIEYSSRETEEKWRIRFDWIKANSDSLTESERHAGTVDGANRVLGPIIAGFQAFLFFCLILAILFSVRYARARLVRRKPTSDVPFYRNNY